MKPFLLLCLLCCGPGAYAQKKPQSPTADSLHWIFDTNVNKDNLVKSFFATVYAHKKIYTEFPYYANYRPCLILQNYHGFNRFYYYIEKGMIGKLGADSVHVKMKFDEGPLEDYAFYLPAKFVFNQIYLDTSRTSEIIAKLKKAKRLTMYVNFVGMYTKVSVFNVGGLIWNHKDGDIVVAKRIWNYYQDTDKMTSGLTREAQLYAVKAISGTNILPYLMTENYEEVNCLVFGLYNGSFSIGVGHAISLRIRFDDEQPAYYTFRIPGDFRSNELYLNFAGANTFIDKLKHAQKIRIEAQIDNQGTQVIEFDVAGLKWDYIGMDAAPANAMPKQSAGSTNTLDGFFSKEKGGVSPVLQHDDVFATDDDDNENSSGTNVTVHANIYTTQTANNSDANVSTTEVAVNGAVVDATESSDGNKIILHCTYKNTNNGQDSVTIHASFMDANGKVINSKAVRLGCAANSQVSTNITYQNRKGRFRSYRLELQ